MSVTPDTAAEQGRQSVQEVTAGLLTAVWDLAYAGQPPAEEALRLHHAALLMLSASEQLLRTAVGATAPAAAGPAAPVPHAAAGRTAAGPAPLAAGGPSAPAARAAANAAAGPATRAAVGREGRAR